MLSNMTPSPNLFASSAALPRDSLCDDQAGVGPRGLDAHFLVGFVHGSGIGRGIDQRLHFHGVAAYNAYHDNFSTR